MDLSASSLFQSKNQIQHPFTLRFQVRFSILHPSCMHRNMKIALDQRRGSFVSRVPRIVLKRFFLARATQRVTIRLPGASEYHNRQVNVLSCLPDWARCPAFSGLCLCFHCQGPGLYSTKAGQRYPPDSDFSTFVKCLKNCETTDIDDTRSIKTFNL